jgi:hypothetical protein
MEAFVLDPTTGADADGVAVLMTLHCCQKHSSNPWVTARVVKMLPCETAVRVDQRFGLVRVVPDLLVLSPLAC